MDNTRISNALFAELIGTFALVFSLVVAVAVYGGGTVPNDVVPFVALVHGFVLFILIQSVGAVSGGHFNPAVTIALLSIRKIAGGHAIAYIGAQLVGAVLAGFLAAAVIPDIGDAVKYASPAVDPSISLGAGIVFEGVFTFLLVWTIVATAVNPTGAKEWAPLAIASALALGVIVAGPLTGAGLNPARTFGSDITNAVFGESGGFGSVGDFLLAFVVAPIAGGVLAATLYNKLFIGSDSAVTEPPAPSEQSPF